MSGLSPKPEDIPTNPNVSYGDKGWTNWGDWLGTGTIRWKDHEWRPFQEARAFAHSLNLNGKNDWVRYCKGELLALRPKPDDIPVSVDKVYGDNGWTNWGDWLGTNKGE